LNKNATILSEYPTVLCIAIVCFWSKHQRPECRWRNTICWWT